MDSPALCALAAEDLRADPDPDRLQNQDRSSQINLWYRLLTAFAQQEMEAYTADVPQMPTVWYPSVGSMPPGREHGSWGQRWAPMGTAITTTIPAASRCIKWPAFPGSMWGGELYPKDLQSPAVRDLDHAEQLA